MLQPLKLAPMGASPAPTSRGRGLGGEGLRPLPPREKEQAPLPPEVCGLSPLSSNSALPG